MAEYMRVEDAGVYQHITTVDESGKYVQIVKWSDGVVTSCFEGNIFSMGWDSLKDFLRNRKGFEIVNLDRV